MKVTAEPIENSQVVLNIEVEPERVGKAEQQAVVRLANGINIPGFRRGKAPRHVVEMMVGREAVVDEALEKLVPAIYREAVKEANLDPIDEGDVEIVTREPLVIKATVPVRPTVELGDYRSLRIEPEQAAVTDEQVDEVLRSMRERQATWDPVERPAQAGDRVTIDVTGKAGEATLIQRESFDYELDTASNFPAPGFAERLIGAQAGDHLEFTLDYPEDFSAESVRGRTGAFTVTVHAVAEKALPALDDEFARSAGSVETLAELREKVRAELTERAERRVREEFERKVIDAVVDGARVELPPKLIEHALDDMLRRTEERLRQQGIPLQLYLQYAKKTPQELREESRPDAERSVKQEFVLHAIAEREGITVSESEVDQMIDTLTEVLGQGDRRETGRLRRELNAPRSRSRFAHDIMDQKVRTRLFSIARGEAEAAPSTEATAEAAPVASPSAEAAGGESASAPAASAATPASAEAAASAASDERTSA